MGLLVTAGATAIAAWTMRAPWPRSSRWPAWRRTGASESSTQRFDDLGSENEIAHLGQTLNVLLDRVAGALRGEQRLTSELAHELRTPLSGIRGEAELALMSDTGPGHPGAAGPGGLAWSTR